MKYIGVYKITNIVNNKIYIGSSVNLKKRIYEHKRTLKLNKHHSCALQRAVNKYGIDNFIFEIIENCNIDEIIIREQFYIDSLKPEYNILKHAYSNFGHKHTEETKRKLSELNKGKTHIVTEETKIKISESHKGKTFSKETLQKMSQKRIGIKLSQETKNKIKISCDPERCRRAQKKMVESRKINGTYGNVSEKTKKLISQANSDEVIGINVNSGEILYNFMSYIETSKFLNRSEVTLWRIIKNKKVVKNCIWMKKKDYVE